MVSVILFECDRAFLFDWAGVLCKAEISSPGEINTRIEDKNSD